MARPTQPTGITTEASGNQITVKWLQNPEPDIKGYNIYNSTTSGGGTSGYVKLNNDLITIYSEIDDIVSNTTKTVQTVGGVRTTTIVEDIRQVLAYTYTHIDLFESKPQYYVITAVNNNNEESLYSIEIFDTPLILTTNLVTLPIRSASDVALTMIDRIFARHPDIDVKPGTMTRDIHIDPHAYEFGYAYVYVDFLSRSQSFLTLLQIDDPNNTGTSIAVSGSTYKQQLKIATFSATDKDVQNIIDLAFDKLAGNVNVFRGSATSSIDEVVFYTTIRPLATITVPVGTIVSTSATSATVALNFETTIEAQMLISSIDSYFNDATQRYELTVSVQSVDVGEQTNVSAGTIINSTISELQVTNIKPAHGGQDEESNRHLADRAILAFTDLDVGTKDGYLRTVISIQYVDDVLVVDAGHPLMMRDMDYVRKMHVFGKVDIYFEGDVEVTYTETFGFLFNGNYRELAHIVDASDMRVLVVNPDVTTSNPVYLVQEIIKMPQSKYDLTGNFTLYKGVPELSKSEYTLDLVSGAIVFNEALHAGNSISAVYEYKVSVTNEVVLASAVGGEIYVDLTSHPVDLFSESIYLYRTCNFVANPLDDVITTAHIFVSHTGDVVQVSSTNLLPTPLVVSQDYYVINISNTELKLARSYSDAIADIAIHIIDSGVGILAIMPSSTIKLVRNVDYTITYGDFAVSARVNFNLMTSFPTGLLPNDAISASYKYVANSGYESVVGSAYEGQTTANLAHGSVVEAFIIEPDGLTININERNAINHSIGMLPTDTIRITYKFRKASDVVLTNQPVDEIVSVTTQESTLLIVNTQYIFNKADDILLKGNSIYAMRSIRMIYDSASQLPQGRLFKNEDVINLVGIEAKPLSKKGVDINTITVTNSSAILTLSSSTVAIAIGLRTFSVDVGLPLYVGQLIAVVYDANNKMQGAINSYNSVTGQLIVNVVSIVGSGTHSSWSIICLVYNKDIDYVLTEPQTPFGYMTIQRTSASTIIDGQYVNVDYEYGEQITVTYNVNSLIKTIQTKIDEKRHVTADVLVKSANRFDVDLEFTAKLIKNANAPMTKDQLSTSLYAIFDQKKLGNRINQSDVIRIIDENTNVDYVILPLTRMAVSDGTHIAYESLPKTTVWAVYHTDVVTAYVSPTHVLRYKTLGNASDSTVFWRVSQNDMELQMVDTVAEVSQGAGRAHISNNGTIYLSTFVNDDPSSYLITAAYNVYGETGANDIVTTDLDYLNLKSLIIHTI